MENCDVFEDLFKTIDRNSGVIVSIDQKIYYGLLIIIPIVQNVMGIFVLFKYYLL